MLTLGFSYFNDHGKVVWDVADVWQAASAHDKYWSNFARVPEPSDDLDDGFKSNWNKIVNRQRPFDGVSRSENDVMKINGVLAAPAEATPGVRYTVYHYAEGARPAAEMKAKLDLLLKDAHVSEH